MDSAGGAEDTVIVSYVQQSMPDNCNEDIVNINRLDNESLN